ncbi:MAG: heavy metal translocating P-type ATPase [Thiofilum sp.]|uniref:heavy metal translocating P-type ATPase n=1 Tax=Thiofilum sp. TaxID=2212733 RepID=UPI0025DF1AF4|nr:heavy metal translocating P-type ATPase [Thiofilum sp.]MBK8453464.1 cadmium-translocating P-type ATPase [Thiofilum sp.]
MGSTSLLNSGCFHCGLPIPEGTIYSAEVLGETRQFCCMGCQAVAEAIVANGLTDFYRFRTDVSTKPEALVPEALRQLQIYDEPELQKSFVQVKAGEEREAALIMEGIVCAACVWLNEHHVKHLPGVLDFRINYSTHRATLRWDNSRVVLSTILKAISDIGYLAHPFDPGRMQALQKKEKSIALRRVAVAGLGMMQVMMIAVAMYVGAYSDMTEGMRGFLRWISLIMTIPVVFYSAGVFFTSAWRDLRRGRFGMDVPVSIAIAVAFSASVWATLYNTGEVYFDSVTMFTFFLLTGRFLEMQARHKAGQVAEELVRLLPATAIRLRDGEQQVVAVNALEINDQVLIKPGEIVPADGIVLEGISSINESLLSGESLPTTKQIGDTLVGGTVNLESPLVMQVQKVGDSTVLAAIIRLLERAQSEKPQLARLAEKVASRFVPLILITAVAVFSSWQMQGSNEAFWIALSVLVITCPCAFSLATPAALTAATGLLTSQGVLTTRGHALETLAQVTHVVFDKTGTLTTGHLVLTATQPLGTLNVEDCLNVAAGLERVSEHPMAQALLVSATNPSAVQNVQAYSGRGLAGQWNHATIRIGTTDFVAELVGLEPPNTHTDSSQSIIWLGQQGMWLAQFSLQDHIRADAQQAVQALHQQGIKVSLLSGDHPHVVTKVAEQLGIKQALGAQLPADKLAYLKQLQEQGEIVVMVGDGVNDAPVLAAAQVSLAMGSGSQLAQASADMVLLSEHLERIPYAITTAKRMQTIIKQNFAWTIGYNLIAIPIAALGWVAPWLAAIGMSMSSLIVVLNALRLKN